MNIKTRIKAGAPKRQHNLGVKTRIKAGRIAANHNATVR